MAKKPKLREMPLFGIVRPGTEPHFANCTGCEELEGKLTDDDPELRTFLTKLEERLPALYTQFNNYWMEYKFEETQNPIYAWSVYSACKKIGSHMPAWVEEYLDAVAQRVLDTTEFSGKAAGYMLGFSDAATGTGKGRGKGSSKRPYRQFERQWLEHNALNEITWRMHRFPEKTIEQICDDVSKDFKLSVEGKTLKKYYYNTAPNHLTDWDYFNLRKIRW